MKTSFQLASLFIILASLATCCFSATASTRWNSNYQNSGNSHSSILSSKDLLSGASAVLNDQHTMQAHQKIPIYASILGPHHNPQETYSYYWLPMCEPPGKPSQWERKSSSLGESLQGIELIRMPIEIRYRDNVNNQVLCTKRFTSELVEKFTYAVDNKYWYQLILDDLPMWAMVGGTGKKSASAGESVKYVYTHQHITIAYNNMNQIVKVDLTPKDPQPIRVDFPIDFSYSVQWVPSPIKYEERYRRYLDHSFFEHRIHWFSIFNSFLIVLFLSALVLIILIKTLKKDLSQRDLHTDFAEDSGWKQIHGDVFRAPTNLSILSACLGTGFQIIFLALLLIFMATIGSYYNSRGALVKAFVIIHAFTSMLAGYLSGSYYAQHRGKKWRRTALLTAFLLPGSGFLVGTALNAFALFYGSTQMVPFLTIITIFAIFFIITLPLVFVGTVFARRRNRRPKFPCRINALKRPIPSAPWYLKRWLLIILGGLLPFGSIFIETYFIFTSVWSYKYYYVYGFTLMVYLILIVVCACVSIVTSFFLLNAQDYRWPWTSFLVSASTGLYVFLYSMYFYAYKTKMQGLFQMVFYVGYSTMLSFGLSLLCGTLGFLGTRIFVHTLYKNVKLD